MRIIFTLNAEEQPPPKSETEHDAGTEGSGPDPESEEKPAEAAGGGGAEPTSPKEDEKQGE